MQEVTTTVETTTEEAAPKTPEISKPAEETAPPAADSPPPAAAPPAPETANARLLHEAIPTPTALSPFPSNTIEVTIIRPGPSKATYKGLPVHYGEEALRNSVPLWSGAPCFTDHFTRSVRDLAGVYFEPSYQEGHGVKAKLRLIDQASYHFVCQIMADIAEGLPVPDIGLSADVGVDIVKAGDHYDVTNITEVSSIDLVFAPAAGGTFDRVLNSVRDKIPAPPEDNSEKRIRDLQSSNDKLRAQLKNQTDQFQEAIDRYRLSVLEAHPELPRYLITGASLAEIDASLEKAVSIAAQVRKAMDDSGSARIPAGAPPRRPQDISTLTPREKIVKGLEQKQSQ